MKGHVIQEIERTINNENEWNTRIDAILESPEGMRTLSVIKVCEFVPQITRFVGITANVKPFVRSKAYITSYSSLKPVINGSLSKAMEI